jgi:hypothetical protein
MVWLLGDKHRVNIWLSASGGAAMTRSPNERLARISITFIWVTGLVLIFAIGVAWLATLGVAIYQFRFHRGGDDLIGFFTGYAVILFLLGVAFVLSVNRFYDWWADQRMKSLLKEIDAATPTPAQRLNALLKEYEPWASVNLSETLKSQLASSPKFQTTLAEAAKLALEATSFQSGFHTQEERETFQRDWKTKTEKFTERIAREDPLAVEVILKAIEKESQGLPPVV